LAGGKDRQREKQNELASHCRRGIDRGNGDASAQPAGGEGNVDVLMLDRDGYNRVTVPVSIGNQGPFNFLIDTGAQATVVSRELADRLALNQRSPAKLVGMTSSRMIQVAYLHDFKLGIRTFDIETAPLVERANIGTADGVLGLDSLQDQRVLLDFGKQTIEVADAASLGGNRGFDITVNARRKYGQLIVTQASIQGIPVSVILGTGSAGSVGNLALEKKLRGVEIGTAHLTDINGAMEDSGVTLVHNLRIGRAQISTVPLAFVDSPSLDMLGLKDRPAIVLGMSELKLFNRVAIDFKQRKVLLDLPKDAGIFHDLQSMGFGF
jgi:predicted aspartyl protease